jgi:glycine hydroxymethyltransferase
MMKQTNGTVEFQQQDKQPVPSVLYGEHLKSTSKSKMADFAGYLMPLWYSSIADEHQAVRGKAGLFDCTHMGVLKVKGSQADKFLNVIATNDIDKLETNQAQYSYILDAAGNVLDDIIIYKIAEDDFMVVVNAANEPKIKEYLQAVLRDEITLDIENSEYRIETKPEITDLREFEEQGRVDIALQGPCSAKILGELCDDETKQKIAELGSFRLMTGVLGGVDCIVSRTGYTGAKLGFEIFCAPSDAAKLWREILDKGQKHGVAPCGLGARDSLRIEAGLPLYGHELNGEFNISPIEAGYGWAVKLDKDFFVGKAMMEKIKAEHTMKISRMQLPGKKGIRPVRHKDAVLNSDGKCLGWLLSNAKISDKQIALVFADKSGSEKGISAGIYYLGRNKRQIQKGKLENVAKGQKLEADIEGKIISRFARF